MQKRQLGKSDLFVSTLGLGCMSLGTEKKKAERIIHAALDEGINYFDTADLYDFGQNEEMVGQSLKHVRENVIIATKVGNRPNEKKDGWSWDSSKSYIKEAVKESLKRLHVDYIDLYQLHGGTIEDRIEETSAAFEELKDEGFIRYYGISSIRPNVIREYSKAANLSSVMLQYSLLDRRPEEALLPSLHSNGISAVTRGTLAKGLLSDKLLEKATKTGYLDYTFEELRQVLPELRELLSDSRRMSEVAVQFNLAHPAVASVVAGASSVDQIQENAKSARATPLSAEELSLIQAVTKRNTYKDHR